MQYTITFSSRIANPNCTVRGIMTITASNISRIQRNFNILIKVYERILAKKKIFSREVAGPSENVFKKFKKLKFKTSQELWKLPYTSYVESHV